MNNEAYTSYPWERQVIVREGLQSWILEVNEKRKVKKKK